MKVLDYILNNLYPTKFETHKDIRLILLVFLFNLILLEYFYQAIYIYKA